jgi:hypothetical protein
MRLDILAHLMRFHTCVSNLVPRWPIPQYSQLDVWNGPAGWPIPQYSQLDVWNGPADRTTLVAYKHVVLCIAHEYPDLCTTRNSRKLDDSAEIATFANIRSSQESWGCVQPLPEVCEAYGVGHMGTRLLCKSHGYQVWPSSLCLIPRIH